MPIIIHGDDIKAPLQIVRKMSQVFPSRGRELMPFVAIHGSFCGLNIVGSARLDFNEAKNVFMPSDKVDFAATAGRPEISRNHYVSQAP